MLAISNSELKPPPFRPPDPFASPAVSGTNPRVLPATRNRLARLAWVLSLTPLLAGFCQSSDSTNKAARQAERAYTTLRAAASRQATNAAVSWQFGRACFDWAEFVGPSSLREAVAQEGIQACRRALRIEENSAPAHYYLALNLGQLARTRKLGALRLVGEMETGLERAAALDPRFDYAGPHRSLGLLYLDAPGWPASIGSRAKAREHLRKALELSPDFPENWLCWIEALLKWGEKKQLPQELTAAQQALDKAAHKFTGEQWEQAWDDWKTRWQKIRQKAQARPTFPGRKASH